MTRYSINLMFIQRDTDEPMPLIISDDVTERFNIEVVVNQLSKWKVANPDADVNFWFDSAHYSAVSIENTRQIFKQRIPNVKLRDIREIPFIQDNPDWFLTNIPVYIRVDLLKLVLLLYLMEQGNESVVYADMSICSTVDKALGSDELFKAEMMERLQQYGLLIAADLRNKPENQFMQTLNSKELVSALKHTINCCMYMINNWLNYGLKYNYSFTNHQYSKITDLLYKTAPREMLHDLLQAIRSDKTIYIRADVVGQGIDQEWIKYDPLIHGYIMFGNFLDRSCNHGAFVNIADENVSFLDGECVRLGKETDELHSFCNQDVMNMTRTDVNPGKAGDSHYESTVKLCPPPNTDHFSLKYWPDDGGFNIKNIEHSDHLVDLSHQECVDLKTTAIETSKKYKSIISNTKDDSKSSTFSPKQGR